MNRRDVLKVLSGLALGPICAPRGVAHAQQSPSRQWSLGINLAGLRYWATEQPFSNLATAASRWRLQVIGAPFTWDLPLPPMSPEGYPLSVPERTYLESFLVHTSHRAHLPRALVVLYDGEGQLEYIGAELLKRGPGRDEIRDLRGDGPLIARLVSTRSDNPLRNLRLFPSGADAPVQTFRQAFLDRWGSSSVLRFMDWMDANNSGVEHWDQRPPRDRFSQAEGGIAIEYMLELANTLGVAPWFTLPHKATDDYVLRFASEVRRVLDPALPVYVEYSNEVWNGQFEQAQYARQQGLRLGLATNDFQAQLRYYSRRTSEILAIWEGVFAEDKERVVGVYAAQAVNEWTSEVILSWPGAIDHADVLAIAPYFGGSLGSPERAADVSEWTLDRLFDELQREIANDNKMMIERQALLADRFNVRLAAYEGGQHLAGHAGAENNERLYELFRAANRDRRMGALYLEHLNNWRSAGGSTYALYNSMGEYSKWGSWGLLESESYPEGSPKWQAVAGLMRS
jgi:hypothetical protein